MLNWNAHINELSKKISRIVGMLRKTKTFCSVLRFLYYNMLFGITQINQALIKLKISNKEQMYTISERFEYTSINLLLFNFQNIKC